MEVLERGAGQEPPYTIRQMGTYLVVDTEAGLVLLWDRKTSIFLKLSPEFKVGPPAPGLGRPHPRPCGAGGQMERGGSLLAGRVLWLPGHRHKLVAPSCVLDP